jgi:hypothetical protein
MEVHEWEGAFQGRRAHFKMTAVIGHVLSIDFPAKFQHWDTVDPLTLFDAPTIKSESNPKVSLYLSPSPPSLSLSLFLSLSLSPCLSVSHTHTHTYTHTHTHINNHTYT